MICKERSTFNRPCWAHCITGKNTMVLTESERLCVIALDLKKSAAVCFRDARDWARHCQLSWDSTGTKPNWVCSENIAEWGTGTCENNASPASTAKIMPTWLVRGITAMKDTLLGRSTGNED